MALTFATRKLRESWTMYGGKRAKITNVTLDAAYVNGTGYAVTKAQLGWPANETIDVAALENGPIIGGFAFGITVTATGITIKAYKTGAALSGAFAEAATNEAGLNGLVLQILCVGN